MATEAALEIPRNCTFSVTDWDILSSFWHPVAYSDDVSDDPVAVVLLDEELVLYRTSAGVSAARDLCMHRGTPLSIGRLDGDEIVCAYHGYRYDAGGRCTCVPAHPGRSIPGKLQLKNYHCKERYGLIWVCLRPEPRGEISPFPECADPNCQIINIPPMDWKASSGED